MKKSISIEERIKKAEERYYNNKEINKQVTEPQVKEKGAKKDKNIIKKFIKEIVICLLIYFVIYGIQNQNNLFSEDFTAKTKEILNKDIDIESMYAILKNNIEKIIKKIEDSEENDNKTKEINDNESVQNTDNLQTNDENIGGAIEEGKINEIHENEENIEIKNEENEEDINELDQMDKDANYVKDTLNIIKPIDGVVSSRYGLRNPTTVTVPKNHTGIDIAAAVGTKIIAAADGVVILNSSQGDYGKHLKIQNGEIIFVYAHCNKLYVKEGENVKQGQEIAEVGATGNVTGPHLHFEIRYQNRYIDPEKILEF